MPNIQNQIPIQQDESHLEQVEKKWWIFKHSKNN